MTKNEIIYENERLDDLQYKGLKILQNPEEYCFTSDAVLLSSFAKVKRGETVIDFCSGSGVIGILVYAKNEGVKRVICVEIQEKLALMSQRSIEINGLTPYIEVHNMSVQELDKVIGKGIADVVVCNPPYSRCNSAIKNIREEIAVARHEISINIKEIMESAKKLLRFKGRLYIIHQAERVAELIYEMISYGIQPKVLQTVSARADKQPHLVLIEGVYGAKSGIKLLKPLYIYNENNEYTAEAKKLYNIE